MYNHGYNIFDSFKQYDLNGLLNVFTLISFFGGRHIISEFYDHRPDLICNPIVKTVVLFSIIYMNVKNVKISVILFFLYVYFIDAYITNKCNPDYISNMTPKKFTNEETQTDDQIYSQTQTQTENVDVADVQQILHPIKSRVLPGNLILSTIE